MTGGSGGAAAPELGLLVVWPGARAVHEGIVARARELLDVRRVYAVHWSPGLVADNCARLQRTGLVPPAAAFPRQRAVDPLLLVTVADSRPRHVTSRGGVQVNARLLDATHEIRASAEGTRVHASATAREAARDLMLLLGTAARTHLEQNPHPWDGRIEEIHRDLSGARGWSTPTELFHTLNHTVRYVVLRNFESLPHSLHVGSHEDVDLLTDDYPGLIRVMNARPHVRCIPRWGGPHWVRIAGEDLWFDLRFVGDRYYDPKWAREILDRRQWNAGGFFTPSVEDYFESLAYHSVVHKSAVSADYRHRLAAMASALGRSGWEASALGDPARVEVLLGEILRRRGCRYRKPRDVNVFFNFAATGHRWPHLRRKLAGLFRKAVRIAYRLRRRPGARYWGAAGPGPTAPAAGGSAPPPAPQARRPAA